MATNLVADLIDRVQQLAGRVDASHRDRVRTALDEAIQWFASRVPWDSLKEHEDFRSGGSRDLILPDRVNKVITISDAETFTAMSGGDHWEKRTPGAFLQDASGQPQEWRDFGYVPVISQPATDTTLSFQSTVSEGFDVHLRGLVRDTTASGTALELYEVQETIRLDNESAVATANAYVRVLGIQKPKFTVADVHVTDDTSTLKISRIPAWETRPLFRRIQLHFVPTARPFRVNYFKRPDRLTTETDAIDPGINEEAVVWRAVGNISFIENEDNAAGVAWGKAEDIIEKMKTMEETFGEKDSHIAPWIGYLNLESQEIGPEFD